MQDKLSNLKKDFEQTLKNIRTEQEREALREQYLGKKGKLKEILAGIKDLSSEEKQTV